MTAVLPFSRIDARHTRLVGGKARVLAGLMQTGVRVPDGLCVTTRVYRDFVHQTGLGTRIGLELGRLPLADRRWEEIWDLSLRIRNLFLTTPLPTPMKDRLTAALKARFGRRVVAVRSSSPQEDRAGTSFAGLHESYVNVRGAVPVVEHIRLVWASLWSDGALLYRRELGMDARRSAMAVIVQELVSGECSGVAFSKAPDDADHMVVEAVHGLNQGLVDGSIAPDRWTLDRRTGRVLSHTPALRDQAVRIAGKRVATVPLTDAERARPPLDERSLSAVFRLAMDLETHFGRPQDVEWTLRGGRLHLLQSRPVTTLRDLPAGGEPWSADDKRPWYLSLRRSLDNLKTLRRRIEEELLPQMAAEADRLARIDLAALSDGDLIEAIDARRDIHRRWVAVYWRDFIPFAHGARLFGQVYNDRIRPDDPYAFTALLVDTPLIGLERNRALQALADMIRSRPSLRERLACGGSAAADPDVDRRLDDFLAGYGDLTFKADRFLKDRPGLIRLLLEMADRPATDAAVNRPDVAALAEAFIARFPEEQRAFAREILSIGRASYRLRDNDNIVLSRIEAQLLRAVDEGKRRIGRREDLDVGRLTPGQVVRMLADPSAVSEVAHEQATLDEPVQQQARPELTPVSPLTADADFVMRARQIVGQPAGQGLAMGPARVIATADDLFRVKTGDVLVCDAIDPTMTLVVPLAAAIVERRGGMLVHGAIIAREYGLPCVTGVADATTLIHTGDRLTVDGYLGIVTIDR